MAKLLSKQVDIVNIFKIGNFCSYHELRNLSPLNRLRKVVVALNLLKLNESYSRISPQVNKSSNHIQLYIAIKSYQCG